MPGSNSEIINISWNYSFLFIYDNPDMNPNDEKNSASGVVRWEGMVSWVKLALLNSTTVSRVN